MDLSPSFARDLLFWLVCIPTRYGLAIGAEQTPYKSLVRAGAGVVGTWWVLDEAKEGDMGFFGGIVWWEKARRIHGLMYLLFAATGNATFLKADVGVAIGTRLLRDV